MWLVLPVVTAGCVDVFTEVLSVKCWVKMFE